MEDIKSRAKPYVSKTAGPGFDDFQNTIWKRLLGSNCVNSVLKEQDFLNRLSRIYQIKKSLIVEFWRNILTDEIRAYLDFNNDGTIVKEEMINSAQLFGHPPTDDVNLLPMSAAALVDMWIKPVTQVSR